MRWREDLLTGISKRMPHQTSWFPKASKGRSPTKGQRPQSFINLLADCGRPWVIPEAQALKICTSAQGLFASLNGSGSNFVIVGQGFDDVKYASIEMLSGSDQDIALLSVLLENGNVLSTNIQRANALLGPNGDSVQFFGGIDDFDFIQHSQNVDTYGEFMSAVDEILSGE